MPARNERGATLLLLGIRDERWGIPDERWCTAGDDVPGEQRSRPRRAAGVREPGEGAR